MDVIDTMTHFSHRQHAHYNTLRDANSVNIKLFMACLIGMGLVHKSRNDQYLFTCNFTKHLSLVKICDAVVFKTFSIAFIFLNVTHKSEVTFGPQCVPTCVTSCFTWLLNFWIRILNTSTIHSLWQELDSIN